MLSKVLFAVFLSLYTVHGNKTVESSVKQDAKNEVVKVVNFTDDDVTALKNLVKSISNEFKKQNASLENLLKAVKTAFSEHETKLHEIANRLGSVKLAEAVKTALVEDELVLDIVKAITGDLGSDLSPRSIKNIISGIVKAAPAVADTVGKIIDKI